MLLAPIDNQSHGSLQGVLGPYHLEGPIASDAHCLPRAQGLEGWREGFASSSAKAENVWWLLVRDSNATSCLFSWNLSALCCLRKAGTQDEGYDLVSYKLDKEKVRHSAPQLLRHPQTWTEW